MTQENPMLPMDESVVEEVLFSPKKNINLGKYADLQLIRLRDQQQFLSEFIESVVGPNDALLFDYQIGCAITFDAITRGAKSKSIQLRAIPEEIINVHKRNSSMLFDNPRWEDNAWVTDQLSRQGSKSDAEPLLSSFLTLLGNSCLDLEIYLECLPDQEVIASDTSLEKLIAREKALGMKYFARGVYDVFMPFYIDKAMQGEFNSAR